MVPVDLISMHRLRIAGKSFVTGFYLVDQVDPVVEVIPTDLVCKADPINKTDADNTVIDTLAAMLL